MARAAHGDTVPAHGTAVATAVPMRGLASSPMRLHEFISPSRRISALREMYRNPSPGRLRAEGDRSRLRRPDVASLRLFPPIGRDFFRRSMRVKCACTSCPAGHTTRVHQEEFAQVEANHPTLVGGRTGSKYADNVGLPYRRYHIRPERFRHGGGPWTAKILISLQKVTADASHARLRRSCRNVSQMQFFVQPADIVAQGSTSVSRRPIVISGVGFGHREATPSRSRLAAAAVAPFRGVESHVFQVVRPRSLLMSLVRWTTRWA